MSRVEAGEEPGEISNGSAYSLVLILSLAWAREMWLEGRNQRTHSAWTASASRCLQLQNTWHTNLKAWVIVAS